MNTFGIIIAVATVGGVGLIISIFLTVFGNIFKVEVDEKEQTKLELAGDLIEEVMPLLKDRQVLLLFDS